MLSVEGVTSDMYAWYGASNAERCGWRARQNGGERACSAQVQLQRKPDTGSVCTLTLLVDNDNGRDLPAYGYKRYANIQTCCIVIHTLWYTVFIIIFPSRPHWYYICV